MHRSPAQIRRKAPAMAVASLIILTSAIVGFGSTPAGAGQANSAAWSYFDMLNTHRNASGVASLQMHPGLVDVAQAWANNLAATETLAHNPNHSGQIQAAVSGRWTILGENAGVGGSVSQIDTAFMNSPPHRANALNGAYNYVGVGTATSSSGRLYIVVDFVGAYGPQPVINPGIPSTDATPLVRAVYVDFFGRAPSASELSYWVGQLTNGTSTVPAFLSQMATSTAWAGKIVTNFYQQTLGRSPDSQGFAYWMSEIRRGRSMAEVAASFYSSNEYFQRSGGTLGGWLDAIYRSVLGRSVDTSGLNYWTGRNQQGLSRGDIAYLIYQSTESLVDRVQVLYQQLLGRPADPAGLSYWVGQLRRTGNDIDLAVDLAGSAEYLNRAKTDY